MQPSVPIPTDNIYKFVCLFGLAITITAVFSCVGIYSSSLDRKIVYAEANMQLQDKVQRTKAEEDQIAANTKLLEVTKENEHFGYGFLIALFFAGLLTSGGGAAAWYDKVQKRDDRLGELQISKLELEIEELKRKQVAPPSPSQRGETTANLTCPN